MLSAIERIQTATEFLVEFRELGGAGMVVLLKKPERLPNYLVPKLTFCDTAAGS